VIRGSANPTGPVGRSPTMGELVRAADLERSLRPLLAGGLDGIAVFAADGSPFASATDPASPLSRWAQLPAEATQVLRSGQPSFGLEGHRFDVRPLYAGAERVAVLVVARRAEASGSETALVEGVAALLGQLLQAGFAAWVTSEMHLLASESTHRELSHKNAELSRAIEHLREIDKLKSNFLATVSHELRTPLTSVIGFSEMLLEGLAGPMSDEQREYVQTIFDRGEELLALITQILEMSQLEVGAVRLNLQPQMVADLVQRATDAMRLPAERSGVQITTELPELPHVLVDPDKLHRVLVNLIGNAVKFTRPGGHVAVSARRAPIRRPFEEETLFGDEIADAVRLTVVDTGIGIPPEQLSRIFEAFVQVDAGPTREHGGAGLGLSIVRSLVTAHGGEVWAESQVGRGTSVHFTVPSIARDPS
jgi:signal transduction histidine kinase